MQAHLHMGEHNIRYEDIEAAAEENGRSVARPSTSWSARKPGTGATTPGPPTRRVLALEPATAARQPIIRRRSGVAQW